MSGLSLIAAVALPFLLGYSLPPVPTAFNQLLSLALWGGVVLCLGTSRNVRDLPWRAVAPAVAALGLLLIASLAAASTGSVNQGWALVFAACVAAAGAVLLAAAKSASGDEAVHARLMRAFHLSLVAAGALSACIAMVQIFWPEWSGSQWVAGTAGGGRAVGNVRQANQLSSLLLFAAASLATWVALRRLRRSVAWGLMTVLVVGMVLSGSRAGMVGVAVLALWGVVDRRLDAGARRLLVSTPMLYGAAWATVAMCASYGLIDFGSVDRLSTAGGESSDTRLSIWRNTLSLIAANPWRGVGFGEFNFALMLTPLATPLAESPVHAHNLPLQLFVELGVPLGLAILVLLGMALFRGARAAWQLRGEGAVEARGALMIVLLIALHSQLEYPLWFVFFLLPSAWALGACMGAARVARPDSGGPAAVEHRAAVGRIALPIAGVAMLCGAALGLADYLRVSSVFVDTDPSVPMAQRVAAAQESWFFAHYADYAAAVTARRVQDAPLAFARAPHFVLDGQMLRAWSRALAQQGDIERARYVAQRLKEFRAPDAQAFFKHCDVANSAPLPYQCTPPTRELHWTDFR